MASSGQAVVVAQLGTTQVRVVHGSAVTSEADVIVNSTNTHLQCGGPGTISRSFHEATEGKLYAAFAQAEVPRPLGEILITKPFGLPCSRIANIVMMGTQEEEDARGGAYDSRLRAISGGLRETIRYANREGLQSLSTPVFGVGNTIKYSTALETIVKALRVELDKPTSLERVDITVLDEPVLAPTRRFVEAALVNASLDIGASVADGAKSKAESSFVTSAAPFTAPGLAGVAGVAGAAVAQAALAGIAGAVLPSPLGIVAGAGIAKGLLGRKPKSKPHRRQAVSRAENRTTSPRAPGVDRLIAERADLLVENANLVRKVKSLEEQLARRDLEDHARGELPVLSELAQPAAFAAAMVAGALDPLEQRESLYKSLAVLLRYLGALMLADYHRMGAPSPEVNRWVSSALSTRLTDGGWHQLILKIASVQREGGSFFPECPQILVRSPNQWSPLLGNLRKLVDLRNEVHQPGVADRSSALAWLERALPIWKRTLSLAEPILRYPLFSVDGIAGWSTGERISYRVRWLVGESVLPRAELVNLPSRLEPDRLYLRGLDGASALPLFPFLTYARCDVLGTNETYAVDRLRGSSVTFVTFRFSDTKDLQVDAPGWLRGGG